MRKIFIMVFNASMNTQTPRIIYVVNARMPNELAHGIQIANTCEGIANEGAELVLVTPMFTGPKNSLEKQYGITQRFMHRKLCALDIPHLPARHLVRSVTFFMSVQMYLLIELLLGIVRNRKTVVYVRGEVILALIPFTFIMPVFFETHQIRNYERWYRRALERVRGIVVVTDRLKEKFVTEYGLPKAKILVARDSVDLGRFRNAHPNRALWAKHHIPETQKIVLYSGRLSEEKGVDTLAQAALHMPEDVQVVFLGGTEGQQEALRAKYGGQRNISVIGRVGHTEVPEYTVSADILVLPDLATHTYNNLYTSPMKLFEYMASGRPIVASRVSSLMEVLDEQSAELFESGNPEALALGVSEVLGHPDRARERASRAYAKVAEFTWEKRAQAILAHMHACVEEKQRSFKGP